MKLVSVTEYAQLTSSAPSTIRALCQKGKLPAFKLGSNWKIDLDKAEAMAEELIEDNMACPAKREQIKAKPQFKGDFKARLEEMKQKVYDQVRSGTYKEVRP